MHRRANGNDPLLAPLFASGDETSRNEAIREILMHHAREQVDCLLDEEVGRGRLATADRHDLSNEIVLRLLRKLRQLAGDPAAEPITRLADYIGATAHNAVDDYHQRRDPLRRRLAIRVRYVLTHTRRLAQWGREPALCGLAIWSGLRDSVPVAEPGPVAAGVVDDAKQLRRVVEEVLERSGGPVELQSLVAALAAAFGLHPRPFVPAGALVDRGVETDPLDRLAGRQALDALWSEIVELPSRQRVALLLQLRLEDGESAARILVALGIVRLRALAESLELSVADLLTLWNELPLADNRIAAMLDATRQQVINLRKSARERLTRHMGRPR